MIKIYKLQNAPHHTKSGAGKLSRLIPGIMLTFLLLSSPILKGQQVIGSFPSMDGGFENQSGSLSVLSSVTSPQTNWTNNVSASAAVISSTGGRSGPKYVTFTMSGTSHKRLQSPTADMVAGQYTIQYYYQGDMDGGAYGDIRGAVSSNGTTTPAYGAYVSGANTGAVWTKYSATVTTATYVANIGLGIVSVNNTAQFLIDDFVIYAGAADITAPNVPGAVTLGNITETSIDVSWGAASGGVDGGGYVVVRFGSDPGTGNDPNQNGIYAIGNSVTTGGTVVYIGTGLTFTDNGLTAATPYWYKVYTADKAFNYSDESTANGSTTGTGTPTLSVTPGSLSGFNYLLGSGPSAYQTYNLSGSNLTGAPGTITITGTTHYEVSTDDVTYGSSASVSYTSATLTSTPIYVKLVSGLAVNTYNGENVSNDGGGISTPVNVICNGIVYWPEPTNHATGFSAGVVAGTSMQLNWTDATDGTLPTGYLIKGSTTSFAAITNPADGVPEADALLVKNVAAGVQTVNITGLQPNTTYYFEIFPYTNSGTYINYKTDGTVPQYSGPTLQLYFQSAASGAWNAAATWEISNNGTTWTAATTEIPIYNNCDVTIRTGHLVNVPLSYNTGAAKNLTVENGATLYANSTTGSCFVYVYGNFTNNGTVGATSDVIGFDIEGANCNLSGNGTFQASRMAKFTTYSATTNLTINQDVTLTYTSASSSAMYNGATTTMFNIIVAPGKNLTVPNAYITTTYCTFTLQSDATGTASLIAKGVPGTGTTTVQRYVNGWTDASHGWHFLSSPNAAQAIDPAFTDPTPANYDFYKWDEVTDTWLNQKVAGNGITNFSPGVGYLVAYASAGTKAFTGTINSANVVASNLTISGGTYSGWNLLGNPFPCALKWNDGTNWVIPAEIAGVAKIWNEPSASYTDIPANGFIPAGNGFMVQVLSGSPASLTIPIAARVHNSTPWYKSEIGNIKLIAYDKTNNTAQECVIGTSSEATEGFDGTVDSRFLNGYAPEFYSIVGSEMLSTNMVPSIDNSSVIELGFVKNSGSQFSIALAPDMAMSGFGIYLTDKKTGADTELKPNVEYTFTSNDGDDPARFLLHFDKVGIDDPTVAGNFRVYSGSGKIFIFSNQAEKADVTVTNLFGQVVMASRADGNGLTTLNAENLQSGVYIVRLAGSSSVFSAKVLLTR
jgi:hypothetical protein